MLEYLLLVGRSRGERSENQSSFLKYENSATAFPQSRKKRSMHIRRTLMLVALGLILAIATLAAVCSILPINCTIHDGWKASYTGTRMIDGAMVGIYHCPFVSPNSPKGHDLLVRCQ